MNPYRKVEFEHLGYHLDYHVNGKYIGSKKVKETNGREIGYVGKETNVATEDIVFKKKRIKKGTEYYTFLYPLCGKSNINISTK